MLEAKEVNFAYRRGLPVLNDIACTIGDGEFVALLGHNGSGKTTLSRLFMALLHPRSGQVLVDGEISSIMSRPTWLIRSVMYSRTRICRFWKIRFLMKWRMGRGLKS